VGKSIKVVRRGDVGYDIHGVAVGAGAVFPDPEVTSTLEPSPAWQTEPVGTPSPGVENLPRSNTPGYR
jgi:hypothetical protein